MNLFQFLGGTDIFDQRCAKFTVSTRCNRWTKKFLEFQIDTSVTNGQTVWSLKTGTNPRKSDSFQFRMSLGKALVFPHMRDRSTTRGLQADIKKAMSFYIDVGSNDNANQAANHNPTFPQPPQGRILDVFVCV